MLTLVLSTDEYEFSTLVETVEKAGAAARDAVLAFGPMLGEADNFEVYDEENHYMGWISYRGRFWKAKSIC